ncbi:eukaryotic translation elongation factor 1 epsilon-1 isoform X1 [Apteryx rowi]|uniref:eukaryotic translation elongation factor 1 epsilon-1 isoform X1 n=1 Tax=Apteryx rowi TaxID=308060 RepID=UPI000E1C4B13|nr:eukaryotic translation elongation factor 1 epsilon-1 isoform X1 [Apteryx rowi]
MAQSFGPIAVKVLSEAWQRCLPIGLAVLARCWVLLLSQVACCENGSCGAARAGGGGAGAAGEVAGPAEREQIPVLQTNNGPSLIGLITVAAHLVKQAKKEQLLGSTAEEKAVVQQWLEYRVTRVDGCSSEEDTRIILKDLNAYLEDKVYLAGNSFTLADILMYYGLHPVMADLTVQEKEKYLNVSRWFNHIQHYPGVRQHLSNVIFIKNRLYTNAH